MNIKRNIPNILTVLRVLLIYPIIYCLFHEVYGYALTLFIIAGLTDGLDGILARRYHWQTRFGSIIDPIADKLLIIICFISLYLLGHLPLWLVAVVLGRDLIILAGALAYHVFIGRYTMEPSMLSKINTCLQLLFLTLMMVQLAIGVVPQWGVTSMMYLVSLVSMLSCLDYIFVWGSKAWHTKDKREVELKD